MYILWVKILMKKVKYFRFLINDIVGLVKRYYIIFFKNVNRIKY